MNSVAPPSSPDSSPHQGGPPPAAAEAAGEQAQSILRALGLDESTCAVAAWLCAAQLRDAQPGSAGLPQVSAPTGARSDAATRMFDDARRLEAMTALRMREPADPAAQRGAANEDDGAQLARLRELLLTIAADVRVVLVAIASRLALLRTRSVPPGVANDFARQCLDVYAPLAGRLGVRTLKWELEDLAFRTLDEATYKRIARGLAERRVDREAYVKGVVSQLGDELASAGINADVSGRPKHIYSIFRKMQDKNLALTELFDLRALRVLVADVADCYAVLGIVHTHWPHIPRQFDDYVTKPKPNGYQSLHTAVHGPSGRTLEIQIRTRAMHEHAEFGVAAHWQYKESGGGGTDTGLAARMAWMRQMLDGGESDERSGDLLERLRSELLSERVYAVTPAGTIVELSAGATALDFAYTVHTDLGHQCRGARVNGALAPLNRPLRSGDQVEVLRDRKGTPSRDWLNTHLGYLASTRARAKVRQWFRQQDFEQNRVDGEHALAREFKRLAIAEPDKAARAQLLGRFNFTRYEDLAAAVGGGDLSTAQVVGALAHAQAEPRELRVRAPSKSAPEVHAFGIGNLLTQLARCCSPVPPEAVRGYVTRGRGITIHRASCGALERAAVSDPERVIDIDWGEIGSQRYPVRIEIEAIERRGLLRDITAALSNERVDVTAMEGGKVSRDGIKHLRMTLEVSSVSQLARILDRVRIVPNVFEVRRAQ